MVDLDGNQVSLPFLWTSSGKLWVTGDDKIAKSLCRSANVVIDSEDQALYGATPCVLVSPFGVGGERHWKASSPGLFHAGGLGYVTPRAPLEGAAQLRPPQAPAGNVAEYFAGVHVATVLMAHVMGRAPARTNVATVETLIPLVRRELAAWMYQSHLASRQERLWRVAPSGFYRALDGFVYVNVVEDHQWTDLCELIGAPTAANDPIFRTAEIRFTNLGALTKLLSPWFARHTCAEIFHLTGAKGVPVGPANTIGQLRASPHLRHREAFDTWGGIQFPALPLVVDGSRLRPTEWNPDPGRDSERVLEWLASNLPSEKAP
jgi:crotonobetainyl-CoA:carnitine CoA-transferase CaiB-like acyl-CoA transferase